MLFEVINKEAGVTLANQYSFYEAREILGTLNGNIRRKRRPESSWLPVVNSRRVGTLPVGGSCYYTDAETGDKVTINYVSPYEFRVIVEPQTGTGAAPARQVYDFADVVYGE